MEKIIDDSINRKLIKLVHKTTLGETKISKKLEEVANIKNSF